MLFKVDPIDFHYMTDRHQWFDLKISKLKIMWKINFKVNYPFNALTKAEFILSNYSKNNNIIKCF